MCTAGVQVNAPCLRGTGLYELWKTGRYKSYPAATLVDLVARWVLLVELRILVTIMVKVMVKMVTL